MVVGHVRLAPHLTHVAPVSCFVRPQPASSPVLRTLTAHGSYTRQLVMTSDHGTLGLDWWCGSDKASWAAPDAPIVLFIHGINGERTAAALRS